MIDKKLMAPGVLGRIKEVLGVSSDKEVAEYFGISSTSVHNWKRRGSIPYDECVELAIAKKASLEWLLFGDGDEAALKISFTMQAEGEVLPSSMAGHSRILIYSIEAAAGTGRLFEGESIDTTVYLNTDHLKRDGLDPSRVVGVRVRGDSMGDTLNDGDQVLVDRSRRIPDGVFLLRMDDGLRIKRVQRVAGGGWRLISDNPHYPPEIVDPLSNQNVEIIGECVMRLGRIR
ncbi:S24 family peptidase [Kushneria sp. Sum13]|uniref:S24 family peptidase n=1 Tax=Kushneria sp. Sum13 TaxID=3459196 RepID=UPI00404670B4